MIRIGHPPTAPWKRRPVTLLDQYLTGLLALAAIIATLLATAAG